MRVKQSFDWGGLLRKQSSTLNDSYPPFNTEQTIPKDEL